MILWLLATALATETVLIADASTWSFLDTGVDPASDWNTLAFDDSTWGYGPAPLGYGEWSLGTEIDEGPDLYNRPITNWFRHEFTATGVAALQSMSVTMRRDDGAVVYLNGTELLRTNMPLGPVTSSTAALLAVEGSEELEFHSFAFDTSLLVEGSNILAVELHQVSGTSADTSMDLSLSGWDGPGAVVRGPYLQQTTDDGVTIRWRTEGPSEGRVWTGAAPGSLTVDTDDGVLSQDHEISLTGVGPSTTLSYAVGTPNEGILAGDDSSHNFTTHPVNGTQAPARIWVLGDCGTANTNQEAVRDAYALWSGGADPDVLLLLGDNAYNSGTDIEYQAAIFDMYPDTIKRTSMWSCIGNHDGYTANSITQTGPYFDLFTFPASGEGGGEPSGTEAYYSFDYGSIHFISLDSYGSDRSVTGAMLTWLEADLAATTADWVIAIYHHPSYSKGSHNSDVELGLVEMRENANPILEAWGVDLVLMGHSHSYERSFLLDGHYDSSTTYDGTQALDEGDGNPTGDGAYRQLNGGMAGNEGAVYAVAGSSGKVSFASLDHPAMQISLASMGSMVIDVDGDVLDGYFINDAGVETDRFQVVKQVATITEMTGPRNGIQAEIMGFSASGSMADGTALTGFTWDFGDGSPTEQGPSVSHSWLAEGDYPLTVTTNDDQGQPFSRVAMIHIENAPPILDPIALPASCDEGEEISWTGSATDPAGDPITYSWDFGDGTILEGQTVDYALGDDGPHTLTLTATDDGGASDEVTAEITCNNLPPTMVALTHGTLAVDETVTFTALWTDPGRDDEVTVEWVMAGGLAVEGDTLDHTFTAPGDHSLDVTLTDDDGGTSQYNFVLTAVDGPPAIDVLGIPGGVGEGDEATFSVQVSDDDGMTHTTTWDFGDGTVAIGDSVDHAFEQDGLYAVTVTVDDGTEGGQNIITSDVAVANQPARIDSTSIGTAIEGQPAALAAFASDPGVLDVLTITWTMPDGQILEGPFVTWTPIGDDAVTAVVEVTDDQGAGESQVVGVAIENAPPTLDGLPDVATAFVREQWTWQVEASDPGGDPLSYDLFGPEGAWVDEAGLVRWSPRTADVGTADFTLMVSDDEGASTTLDWTLAVKEVRDGAHADWRNRSACDSTNGSAAWWVLLPGLLALRRRRE